MNPVNQFILGSNPYLDDLDTQIAKSKEYQQRLMQLKQNEGTPLWDKIDSEINTLTLYSRVRCYRIKSMQK